VLGGFGMTPGAGAPLALVELADALVLYAGKCFSRGWTSQEAGKTRFVGFTGHRLLF
jgi:hypothetical protein